MKQLPKVFIIFLSVDWNQFNRREMVKALADTVAPHKVTVIAVNRPLCPFTTFIKKRHRIRELFTPAKMERLSDNLILYSPRYFLHDHVAGRFGFLENLNIMALRKSFGGLFRRLSIKNSRPVVWYYYPQQGYIRKIFRQCFVIYEMYDALVDLKGRAIPRLNTLEKALSTHVDLFLAEIDFIFNRYAAGYKNSCLFGNGLSRMTFESLKQIPARKRSEYDRPQIGYAGMVSDRIAWDLIREIARQKPGWDFIFHGLIADRRIPGRFKDIDNIKFAGLFTQGDLPAILGKFDLGILPYTEIELHTHIHPLKFFEYAAAGLPIVSSLNDELKDFSGKLIQMPAYDASSWIVAIERQLSSDRTVLKSIGVKIAEQYVWDNLCEKLIEKISELCR